ncbi:Immunoglobulin I-set domain protein [Aphelenchoides besseyi]|nr:Immunoglobulin I-set domain protein [Aphelenchoides besseyi]KAI6201958.1 Immunoglobulin I-set domain protein [Aphelenchoides besseyi]
MFSAVFILLLLLYARPYHVLGIGGEPVIKEHPLDVLVVKNDPATLRCNVSGDNVKITWYKDDQPVNTGNAHRLILPNGSLFLLRADHDLGTYYCFVSNEFGNATSQLAHVRQATLRDEFRVRPHNVNAVLGKDAILECSPPRGFPEPSVSWRRDDHPLPDNRRYSLHPSGNLIIENVQRSDSGLYTCVAMNMVGERTSPSARLFVSEKPRFLVEPKDVVGEVNSSVLFDCRVAGEPVPTVSWKKRNCVPIDEYTKCSDNMPIGRAYITEDSRGLRIERVQPQDEGEYVCVAKNGAGDIESSARLRVNSPPVIVRAPIDVLTNIGERAVLNCDAIGRPKPSVFWSKDGDPLFSFLTGFRSIDGHVEVTEAGSLILSHIKPTDKGVYTCAAVNSAGSALKKAVLKIELDASEFTPPPLIIYGPSAQTIPVRDLAMLPCQANVDNQVNVTWYRNGERIEQNSRFNQAPSGTLRISDLRKSDSGEYICQVETAAGLDKWSALLQVEEHNNPSVVFDRMPDKTALPSAPSQPRIKPLKDGSGLEIEWNPPEHTGDSPISHYTVRYWSPSEKPPTWITIGERIIPTRYLMTDAKPGAMYWFMVRANNARGAGEPSPIANIAYVVNDHIESRTEPVLNKTVKIISVHSMGGNSALINWNKIEGLDHDGFYLTWRGPPLSDGRTMINLTTPKSTSAIIDGLQPFSVYDFFLIPYRGQKNLTPSNSMELQTPEGKPGPPRQVFARMENLTSVMIAFMPPAANDVHGTLRGFDIRFVDNSSSYENTIRTKANARSITLKNMRPGNAYQAHIAALNGFGRSDFVSTELFTMNEATLQRHQKLYGEHRHVGAAPIFWLAAGGALLAVLLFALAIIFGCKRWNRTKAPRERRSCPPSDDFANIKINDGSVAASREEYWPETSMPFHMQPTLPHAHHIPGHHNMPQLASPRTPPHYYHTTSAHHACCANAAAQNLINAYGTALRPHYSGPYLSSNSTLNRGDEAQYHYAILPNTLPPPHSLMTYEDDPSPYASTTITSNGYGPQVPSNPIPPPPIFAQQHPSGRQIHQSNGSTNSMRRVTSGRRTPRTNPHVHCNGNTDRSVPAPAPMMNGHGPNSGELELGKILAQVRPPMTYDSVTDELSVPNYTDGIDGDDSSRSHGAFNAIPNRILNSRSPPRTMRSATDESEERNLLNS